MDIDIASSPADRIASFGAGPLITGTSDHHGSFSVVGFPGRGELADDGRVWGAWLADRFAAARHYRSVLGGSSGARLRDRTPNKITTANSRPAGQFPRFGEIGVHGDRDCVWSAAVAEFCRSAKQ